MSDKATYLVLNPASPMPARPANSKLKRNSPPVFLNGALRYDQDSVSDPRNLFRLVRSKPAFWNALRHGTDLHQADGRPRIDGEWGLMFLAFTISPQRDIKRWHAASQAKVWRSAGFSSKPNYWTTLNNFIALEARADAFRAVAADCIRQAVVASDGLVGRDVHVDGTEAETNARLHHDCEEGQCPNKRASGKRGTLVAKANTEAAREVRHAQATKPPEDEGTDEVAVQQVERGKRFQASNGCFYWTRDKDAGIRGFNKKFWHGYYNLKAIDHYTGGVLAVDVTSASENEHTSYPELLKSVIDHTGAVPRAVVGDRGFAVEQVFRQNTTLGIASVIPLRPHDETREEADDARFDRYGIPRCAHCGSPSFFVRFNSGKADNPRPRIWFRCKRPVAGTGCEREQSILCKEGWRQLVPLWRDSDTYHALENSHGNYERRHHEWRDRYLVAGDNHQTRPRRRGLAHQSLRANAALLIEWLGILDREGWLGTGTRKNEADAQERDGETALKRFLKKWRSLGLHLGRNKTDGWEFDAVPPSAYDEEQAWWPPDDRYL